MANLLLDLLVIIGLLKALSWIVIKFIGFFSKKNSLIIEKRLNNLIGFEKNKRTIKIIFYLCLGLALFQLLIYVLPIIYMDYVPKG